MNLNKPQYSIVIPVYNNGPFVLDIIKDLNKLTTKLPGRLETVFVIDGSPDNSLRVIRKNIHKCKFQVKLIVFAKNFGSFTAIRAGIDNCRGKFIAIKAADRQEPMKLVENFFVLLLRDEADIIVGARKNRSDKSSSSQIFWKLYQIFIDKSMPNGGVDMFACNDRVTPYIRNMKETRSSLIGYLFWLGFRRKTIYYDRLERIDGTSGWTFSKKMNYMFDSIFALSDLPIKTFLFLGLSSSSFALLLGLVVLLAKALGSIAIPGYAAIVTISLFFFGLNATGLSIIGNYIWRTYENTKERPHYIVQETYDYQPE